MNVVYKEWERQKHVNPKTNAIDPRSLDDLARAQAWLAASLTEQMQRSCLANLISVSFCRHLVLSGKVLMVRNLVLSIRTTLLVLTRLSSLVSLIINVLINQSKHYLLGSQVQIQAMAYSFLENT